MAALVVPGAPVSVLIDHGLAEIVAEKLMQAGIPTVERLGSMTPEELEEIEGIDPDMVEKIQIAVNSYYGQFEAPAEESAEAAPEAAASEAGGADAGLEAVPPAVESDGIPAEAESESVTIEDTERPETT
jgi:transcription termination/antitermination protein NusA